MTLLCLNLTGLGGLLHAQTAITEATASYTTSAASSYTEAGVVYNYGVQPSGQTGNDLIATGFDVDLGLGDGLQAFAITSFADRINIVRQDNPIISGDKQLLFFEDAGSGGGTFNLRPGLLDTMEGALLNQVINRGTDNVFANEQATNTNNIERIDFIVDGGISVPADTRGDGFVVLERGGNDDFRMAAITSLDVNGDPDAFGPVVSVSSAGWGATQWNLSTQVLASASAGDNLEQTDSVSSQAISGVYVSFDDLGGNEGDVIFGYSLAGGDVSTNPADWVDTSNQSNFPRDTASASNDAGGLDLVAGGSISSRNPTADLALTMTVSDTTPLVGSAVTFTLTVVNNGPFSTIDTDVSALLPSGYTYTSSNPSRGSYVPGSGIWDIGGMFSGETQTLEIVAQVEASGNYLNTATVSGLSDPDLSNNTDSASVAPTFPPSDLSISKTSNAGAPVNHGDTITYTIVVENTGGSAVGGVDVEDILPAGMSYVPGSVTASLSPAPSPGGTFVETLTTAGSGSFTVPAGVTELTVEAWGGGGSGAASSTNESGGGGGGGAYARLDNFPVAPGASLSYFVGAGGSLPGTGNPGNPGAGTWFANQTTLIAAGGAGGGAGSIDLGGAGGQVANSIGDQRFAGGSGGNGLTNKPPPERGGGGGGGSAFATAVGGDGQDGAQNSPGAGGIGEGDGGNGGQADFQTAEAGSPPGGGGGGCSGAGAGAGGDGQLKITYTVPDAEGTTGAAPNLATGWLLEAGSILTVTFEATLDAGAVTSSITNTALFTSDNDPAAIGASVTDAVNGATLGDFVWQDSNGNGLQDAGEPGLAGVSVALLDTNGDAVTDPAGNPVVTTTDAAGAYSFSGLPAGDYRLGYTLPGNFVFTEQDSDGLGPNGAVNSDADPLTGETPVVTVTTGETNTNIAAGAYIPAAISGRIRVDTSGDGIGDSAQAGVTLLLLDANGDPVLDAGNNPITTTTDSNGNYLFGGLAPGSYRVQQTAPTGFTAVGDPDGGDLAVAGDVTPLVVTSNGPVFSVNFVNSQLGALDAPEFCLAFDGNLGGSFVRADDLPNNLTYFVQYTSALGDPTVWDGSVELTSVNTTTTANGDGSETVAIGDLLTLTGLGDDAGFVRLSVELDADNDGSVDETTYSAVSGWVASDFGIECRSYSNPFLSCPTLRATVTAVSGSTLTLDVDTVALAPGVDYYVEVGDGALEGHRFDVASVSGDTVQLASTSDLCSFDAPYNTMTGAPSGAIVGSSIVLRAHDTLDSRFPVDFFDATSDPTTADQVTLRDANGNICYWLYDNGGSPRWVLTGDSALLDRGATVLPPGHGSWVTSRSSKRFISHGQVRANDFVRPLCQGFNAVTGGYPLTQSAVDREYSVASGFTGHPDFIQADQFLIWNGDNISGRLGYQAYYLSDFYNPERWIKTADVFRSDVKTQPFFIRDRAVLLNLKQAIATYRNQLPWSTQP